MSENIKFEFWMKSVYWKDPPCAKIRINGENEKDICFKNNGIEYISFYKTLKFDEEHLLEIERYGKDIGQTKILETGEMLDQMLSIEKIKIDGINIQRLIYINSWNEPEYPEAWVTEQKQKGIELEYKVPAEVDFGFNGTWKLKFRSPFYKHMIDSI